MACEDDFDCPGPQVCYQNVSWDDRGNFCECSTYYGWENIESGCTDYGPGSIFYFITSTTMLLIGSFFLLIALKDAMIFIQFKEARKLTKGVVTFIYCVCGLISLVIFSLMQIGSTSTPLANVENNGGPEKLAKYGIEERLFGILIVFFLFLGSLNISLVWLELSERIRNLSMRSASSKKYQRIIYLFEVGFAAVVIVSVSTGQFIISSLIAFPYVFLLLYIYKRGHGGFREILMTADAAGDSKNTTYLQLAKLVQRTAVIVAVCLGIYFITSLAFSLMLFIEWRQFSPIGGVSYVVLTLQITNIVASIWLGQIFWYSHVNIQQMQKQLSSKDKEAITSEPGNTKPTGLASAKVGFEETHDASTDHSHSI